MASLGDFVRDQRRRLGLTQRQIVEALGLRSVAYWSDVEAGNRRPSQDLFPALARVLRVSVADLEANDVRAPLAKARALLKRHPGEAAPFQLVLEHAAEIGFAEILRRIEQGTPEPVPAKTVAPAPARSRSTPRKRPADLLPGLDS